MNGSGDNSDMQHSQYKVTITMTISMIYQHTLQKRLIPPPHPLTLRRWNPLQAVVTKHAEYK